MITGCLLPNRKLPALGFCFPPVPVTGTSLRSLLVIRNGPRLKTVPRFTKITGCSKTLPCCPSPPSLPSGSLLPPSPGGMPSRLRLLLSPGSLSQERQLSPPGGRLAPLPLPLAPLLLPPPPPCSAPAPACAPAAAAHGCGFPGGPLNPLLLVLGMQEAEPQLAFLMGGGFAAGGSLTITFGLVNQADPIEKVRRG